MQIAIKGSLILVINPAHGGTKAVKHWLEIVNGVG